MDTSPSVVVIGVTGATRCGKGRVSTALSAALGGAAIVSQDQYWFRQWQDPVSQLSEEEPECTDHVKFAQAIQEAKVAASKTGPPLVIAEGFQLLHHASVRALLLGPIHMLELTRDECIRRRSAPRGKLNPNPVDVSKMKSVGWPAHERHRALSIDPLGVRVQRHAAPSTDSEVAAIVDQITARMHAAAAADSSPAAGVVAQASKAAAAADSPQTMAMDLTSLPAHATVAIVTMRGSLCPITLGHVRCFEEARKLLCGNGALLPAGLLPYSHCVGFVTLNGDHHLQSKFAHKREKPVVLAERQDLVRIATADLAWLELSTSCRTSHDIARLQQQFPQLQFDHFDMNGADDVVKYQKWRWAGPNQKMITMGRPGSTKAVVKGMASVGIPDTGSANFVLGPELPDISSTKLRAASKRGDRAALLQLCHPHVADWMLARDGHAMLVPPEDVPEGAVMIVGRQDGGHTTSLRTTPTSPRHSKHMAGTVVETGAAATAAAPPLMAIVRRTDGGGGTLLRKVATTSRIGDVWTEPVVQVRSGEEVEVLRTDPRNSFAWVRTQSGAEGYLNIAYFLSHEQDVFVGRQDSETTTLLRKTATASRDPSVFLDSMAFVSNGDKVTVLQYQPDFSWVQTINHGARIQQQEGFIQRYLSAAEVRRSDHGEGRTLLRVNATASRDPSVFTQPHCSVVDGERVQVLRVATSPGSGYVWVRTANGVEGYLNRQCVFPMVWNNTGVLWVLSCGACPL